MPTMTRLMFSASIARPALTVAACVGTVLNIINNGEHLLAGRAIDPWHVVLNYLVPYCVSSYSAARNEATRSKETARDDETA